MTGTRRKLTTIFSADVQDYTRLMRTDEEGTLATLKEYRDAMSRLIEIHGGRVVNTWGDGLIAEFASVVEAVRAALDIQNEVSGYNADRPDDTQMLFRIGINLGDVIAEDDDIYGDGVNVAARLQASASAGGIVISNTVYDHVRNKVAVGFECLGQLPVKNIEGGVLSYAVRIGEDPVRSAQQNPISAMGTSDEKNMGPGTTYDPGSMTPKWRNYGVLGAISAGIVVVNLLSWDGEFWAPWPILAIATVAALSWMRTNRQVDQVLTVFTIVGLALICINLLSWHGTFWAAWPLLAMAVLGSIRWFTRRRAEP
ncbi:adenylate/guanylate cyclase domain-containing protein [Phyllobacterium bourgognense]|uniref:Class 3 adenylate cyclase n=1 Tax=Phyllobacterium bourgognense TaxID=314236 RepID=A0A368YMU3_9HYPH|nr:adenylate/guanylate cyclase domain-containing protein [Phyllobacterium bourgognense]RCW80919.1 class 3 adenylate cyclase [Phyllobacterium bourgognense]